MYVGGSEPLIADPGAVYVEDVGFNCLLRRKNRGEAIRPATIMRIPSPPKAQPTIVPTSNSSGWLEVLLVVEFQCQAKKEVTDVEAVAVTGELARFVNYHTVSK